MNTKTLIVLAGMLLATSTAYVIKAQTASPEKPTEKAKPAEAEYVSTAPTAPPVVYTGQSTGVSSLSGRYNLPLPSQRHYVAAGAGANINTYNVVTDSGATTIPAGTLRYAITAVGGTITVNIGGQGVKTLPSGYTLQPDAVQGFTNAQSVVVANGTGTAYWTYVTPN